MRDIIDILKDNGIEVPEEGQTNLRKSIAGHYKTINEHNNIVNSLQGQIDTANNTITELKGKLEDTEKVDVKALQDKIKEFEDAEKVRKQKETAAKEQEALKARFSPLKGENKFLNEGTENWMFEEFKKAIVLEENKGKSDSDIFAAITKDKNIYENPNSKFVNPSANGGKGEEKTEFKKFF